MSKNKAEKGVSVFTRSTELLGDDPLEEIFALNLGDFLTEHLISDDLAQKIKKHDSADKGESLKKQLKELISIYSINNTLSVLGFNNKEDYIIYNSIAKTITQMLDIDACHIFLSKEFAKGLDKTDKDIVLVGSSVDFADDLYSHNIGYAFSSKEPVSKAYEERETIVSNKFTPVKELNDDKAKEYIAIPMHNNVESVGVIVIESYGEKKLSPEFRQLAEVTARLFALSMLLLELTEETAKAIEDKDISIVELQHLRAELTATIGDLGEDQQNFVEMLAKAVDAKSQFSENHSQNVADLSRELCNYLGLNEKTKDLIYYAGLLRNIGKITLPSELFNKKGKLSTEDWNKLQNHPNVGVSLLMSINFMSEVIPYIHYHKERWDGKGEPEGLKGNSIPLGSRVIAIADAFCALTADRPYRKAMPDNEALKIMMEEAEIKWDPILVDALCAIVKEK